MMLCGPVSRQWQLPDRHRGSLALSSARVSLSIVICECLILITVSRFYFCFFVVAAGPTMVGEPSSLQPGWEG